MDETGFKGFLKDKYPKQKETRKTRVGIALMVMVYEFFYP
jgi:hypothetical protein